MSTIADPPPPATMSFPDIIAYVRPKPEELRWLDINWRTDLWEARRLSLAESKPIFLWTMNGDPLGCT